MDYYCRPLVRCGASFGLLAFAFLACASSGCEDHSDSLVQPKSVSSAASRRGDDSAVEELAAGAKPDRSFPANPTPSPPSAVSSLSEATDPHWIPPSHEGYVGSDACVRCHAEISASYAAHPMAKSIEPVDIAREVDWLETTGPLVNPGESREYLIRVERDRLFHSERMLDSQGQTLYQTDVPIDYVVGSGQRAVAYLALRDQRLIMSPLNWYTPANRYDFAPSHSAEDPRRFDRRVNDDCLSCHAGQVNALARNSARYDSPPFTHAAIGCENCHGPGASHIRFREDPKPDSERMTDDIVNPAALDHQRREAVCYQCHLHAPARLLRPGRSHYDFRPGDRLDDIWTMVLLDSTNSVGKEIAPVNQVQQMLDSRCYQASDGQLGCISCHDPHGIPAPTERIDFYRNRCLTCHTNDACGASEETRATQEDSCIECHMPARETTIISHISQTDHRILRQADVAMAEREGKASVDTLAEATPKLRFLWDSQERLPQWEQDRALGMALWLIQPHGNARPSLKIVEHLAPVFEQHPEDGATATVLGAFWSQYRSPQRAKVYYEAALNDPNVRETALANLLSIYYTTADWQAARKCSTELLEMDPSNARVLSIQADIFQHFGEFDSAVNAAEKALVINPTLTPVRQWLVRLYQRINNPEQAQRHIEFLSRFLAKESPQQSG